MKTALFLLTLLFAPALLFAGPDGKPTTDSVYSDHGNNWRSREVKMSTHAVVMISSAAPNAGLEIRAWRKRTITNLSTCAVLGLYPADTTNTTYDYSDGITLSSMTTQEAIITIGNTVEISHQSAIKGVWKEPDAAQTPASLGAKRGALITEEYFK